MAKTEAKYGSVRFPVNERTLADLFDYQRFENDPLLEALIARTELPCRAEISDDDLSQINAAGEARPTRKRKNKRDGTV